MQRLEAKLAQQEAKLALQVAAAAKKRCARGQGGGTECRREGEEDGTECRREGGREGGRGRVQRREEMVAKEDREKTEGGEKVCIGVLNVGMRWML